MQKKQERFKSPALWISVAGLIFFVLKTYCNYEIPQFDTLVNMVLLVLAGFGIINNPTDKDNI